jgi:N-acetylneuraminic acid mutarotase
LTYVLEKGDKVDKGVAYLVGGIGERVATVVFKLDIRSKKWSKVKTQTREYGVPRFNHSTVYYKNKLFVFAGETINGNNFSSRTILNDVKMLDFNEGIWRTIAHDKNYVQPRRNHACVQIQSHLMIVHGGLADNGSVLNDFWIFNLKLCTWEQFKIAGEEFPCLTHHTMTCVESSQFASDDSYNLPIEGLFVFGGKKGQDLYPTNDVYILPMYKSLTKTFENYLSESRREKFSKKDGLLSHFYIKPHILGQSPHPRFSHHSVFLPNKGYIVIYGGRNDEMYETSS